MQLYQKAFSRDAWPSVAFTADEGRALHAVTNAVNIYDPASFSTGAPLLAPCFRVHMATRPPWRLLAYTSRHALCRLQPACQAPTLHLAMVHADKHGGAVQAGGICLHLPGANTNVGSELGVYAAAGVVGKLAVKGVAGFAVSPNLDAPMLAAYVPELKGSPGFAGIWPLEALAGRGDTPAPVARRSFFRVRASSAHLVSACQRCMHLLCQYPA